MCTALVMAPTSTSAKRILRRKGESADLEFTEQDINILHSPSGCLKDVCLNGGAAILQDTCSSTSPDTCNRCALLSTFDLPRIRYKASDDDIWRNTRRSSYWLKNIWILPIHRPGHWALCAILIDSRELYLFDSFAAQDPWRRDVNDIMCLVGRLVLLAKRHGHPLPVDTEGWSARPISVGLQFILQELR